MPRTSAVALVAILLLCSLSAGCLRKRSAADRQKFAEDVLYEMLRKDGKISNPNLPYSIMVARVDGRTLSNVVFMRRGSDGKWDLIAHGREGELHVDLETRN